MMACGDAVSDHMCQAICGKTLSCCGRSCAAKCYQCQACNANGTLNGTHIRRLSHSRHPCKKSLHCSHECGEACGESHSCSGKCVQKCRQLCSHHSCNRPCYEPCPPCMSDCTWRCEHHVCAAPCGSVRSSLLAGICQR